VRELENLVKRIVVLESEEFVTQELLGKEAANGVVSARASNGAPPEMTRTVVRELPEETAIAAPVRPAPAWVEGVGLKDVARRAAHEAERGVIKQVLEEVRWNRVEAARRLKISYKALLYKIVMYELAPSRPGGKRFQ
jgi:DNA-binding NtrC family response regulator